MVVATLMCAGLQHAGVWHVLYRTPSFHRGNPLNNHAATS